MRFTKIPLIATLMAVALSLLIVLPALAENRERTDGRGGNENNMEVGVFANIADAELTKMRDGSGLTGGATGVYVPLESPPTPATQGSANHASDDQALLRDPEKAPQSTYFRGTLYVSNDVNAYNTVLINYAYPATVTDKPTTCVQDSDNNNTATATTNATVKNNRTGRSISIELAIATDAQAPFDAQAFFKVVHPDTPAYKDNNGTPDVTTDDFTTAYREFGGPTWCADGTDRTIDLNDPKTPNNTDDDTTYDEETVATSARYYPVRYARDASTYNYPAAQEIATIFANHGDRLTVTIGGNSEDLLVDGEGPEFSAITPEDNAVTRPSRLTFSFEVRDEDSGLRHDGEAVITPDGDYTEINPDEDPVLDGEPLSKAATSAVPTNGAAADIAVNVVANPELDTSLTNILDDNTATTPNFTDISASGEWRNAVSRAGVAYEFTAGGRSYADDDYLYQLTAKDRAGNMTKTDAVADEDDNTADEPFVFRVDDTSPILGTARTGIGYDTAKNKEKADRNFIALDFGADALASVSTSSITVVGHTITGVVHPSTAPAINRGATPATTPVAGDEKKPTLTLTDPADIETPAATKTRTITTRPDGTIASGDLTLADTCGVNTAPTLETPGTAVIGVVSTITSATSEETTYCASWETYRKYLVAQKEYNTAKAAYDLQLGNYNNYVQYHKEHPGTDIEGEVITEPRARIYLELAEDLAPDARPSVIAVGGAATDLAGNTNEAKTLSKGSGVNDWIAPTLTVTVTGTAADRPVADMTDGSFTVDVKADEELNRRPVVYFVSIAATADGSDFTYKIAHVDTATSLTGQETEDHWAKKYKVSSLDSEIRADGLYGVIVLAEDSAENSGATAGWTPGKHRNAAIPKADNTATDNVDEADALDLAKMDDAHLLIEVDSDFNNKVTTGIGTVTPRSNTAGTETESANPFVKLVFANEKGEYKTGKFEDSHDTVTVTSITLNGENAMANLNRVSATDYSLITRDLAVAKHKVEYKVVDDAGNEYEGKFEFDVKERQPYKVDVRPGWNLVSLPATPLEPAIGDVLSGSSYITPVLGYQQGDWLTAIQEEDGTWRGRLETLEGGYGYWVHARTFETIETMLAEVDPAETLPTVPVTAGWNLLGVLDIFQNAAGTAPGESGANGDEADNYFSSIPWKVAYTYDTTKSLWVKSTPKADPVLADGEHEIANGKGYWVWTPTPATLVP